MTYDNLQKRQTSWWVEALTLSLLVIANALIPMPHDRESKEVQSHAGVALPYRIVNNADTQTLYAYELHKRKMTQDYLPEFCAVIKQVNPAKDDYKTYCKSVIADIVKTEGTDKLMVYIYDSNEAYELYETKFLQHYHNLDNAEADIVDHHLVATYTGNRLKDCDYVTNYQLAYYENAHNSHTGQERYQP